MGIMNDDVDIGLSKLYCRMSNIIRDSSLYSVTRRGIEAGLVDDVNGEYTMGFGAGITTLKVHAHCIITATVQCPRTREEP